jgi:SNF2 family DNA or RNA helicase
MYSFKYLNMEDVYDELSNYKHDGSIDDNYEPYVIEKTDKGFHNLCSDYPKIIQSDEIKIKLKEHQKTSVYAMMKMEEQGFVNVVEKMNISDHLVLRDPKRDDNHVSPYVQPDMGGVLKEQMIKMYTDFGILSDVVGAGKTLMIVTLIIMNRIPPIHPQVRCVGNSVLKLGKDFAHIKTNLLIIPHNIFTQWQTLLDTTNLKTICINTVKKIEMLKQVETVHDLNASKRERRALERLYEFGNTACIAYYDVVLITATMLPKFNEIFNNIKYSRIIIDEITSIKIPIGFKERAIFTWFITATPFALYSRSNCGYLRKRLPTNFSLMSMVVVKNNEKFVAESLKLPKVKEMLVMCYTDKIITAVADIVSSEVLEMINANNMHEAIRTMQCSGGTSTNLLQIISDRHKQSIHNEEMRLKYIENQFIDEKEKEESIGRVLHNLSMLNSKLNLVKERLNKFKEEACPICMQDFEKPVLLECCNSLFCVNCLLSIQCKKCPLCRHSYDTKDFIIVDDEMESEHKPVKKVKLLTKDEQLLNIIVYSGDKTILLFTSFNTSNDNISSLLNSHNIPNMCLMGTSIAIKNKIKKFNDKEYKVLLLNSKHVGAGLNIESAGIVVIYNSMDTSFCTQIIGRAQRLGRKQRLSVFFLAFENETGSYPCENAIVSSYTSENHESIGDFISDSYEEDDATYPNGCLRSKTQK